MEMNINSLRQTSESGFLRSTENNQTTTWGTNWASRLVGWNKTSSDENLALRRDFAQAIRQEYGSIPDSGEFIESLMQTMTGGGGDKTPLSMMEVHYIISRMDNFRTSQAEVTTQQRATTHTENMELCDLYAPDEENQTTETLSHAKQILSDLVDLSDFQTQIAKMNKLLPEGDRIKLYNDDTLLKSLLPEIREELIALSDGGKHKITDTEAQRVVHDAMARRLDSMTDIVSDTFRTGLNDTETAQLARQRLREAESRQEVGDDDHTGLMTQATVHSRNKALCDALAPDPSNLTAHSSTQFERTNELFGDILRNSGFEQEVQKMNRHLGDDKFKLYNNEDFLKSLLPEIRDNILARSEGGKHEVTQQEAENIIRGTLTHALERMAAAITQAPITDRASADLALQRMHDALPPPQA